MSSSTISDSAFAKPEAPAWHTIEVDQALLKLTSDRTRGLSTTQIAKKQQHYGSNELVETGGRTPLEIFWDQFKNIMLLMLIAVAIISAILDVRESFTAGKFIFPKDAVAIFVVVLLNGVLGYIQESGAEKALAALKNLASSKVRVIRDSKPVEVESKELVPGDIMLLEAGVKVAADGRLVEAANLQVREAALTGEAHAVNKQAEVLLPKDAPLGDRINLVFSGTEVVQGRATVLVTETGMQTELGKIATALQSVESEPTPLQKRMSQLGNTLVMGALILVGLVIVGGTIFNPSLFEELVKVSRCSRRFTSSYHRHLSIGNPAHGQAQRSDSQTSRCRNSWFCHHHLLRQNWNPHPKQNGSAGTPYTQQFCQHYRRRLQPRRSILRDGYGKPTI
jgi:P-type Ca2+ transporter type 2C